jgi:hypothetical protein
MMMSPKKLYSRIAAAAAVLSLSAGFASANPHGFKSPSQVLKGIRTNPSPVPKFEKSGAVPGAPVQVRHRGGGQTRSPGRPYGLSQAVVNQAYSLYASAVAPRRGHGGRNPGYGGGRYGHGGHDRYGNRHGGHHRPGRGFWNERAIEEIKDLYDKTLELDETIRSRRSSGHDIAWKLRRVESQIEDVERALDWSESLERLSWRLADLSATVQRLKFALKHGGRTAKPPHHYRRQQPGIRIPLDKDNGIYLEFRF